MFEISSSGANLFGSAAGMNPNQSNTSGLSSSSLLAQFGRSNSTSAGSAATSMFSLLGASGAGIGPPPTLDLNEFPSLGGTSISSFGPSSAPGRTPYVGLLKDNSAASERVNEFNIQTEDFPALPGAPIGGGAPQPPQSTTPTTASLQAAFQSFSAVGGTEVVVNQLASLSQQLSAASGVLSGSSMGASLLGGGSSSNSSSMQQQQNNASSSSGTGASRDNNPGRPDSTESSQAANSPGGGASNSQATGGNSGTSASGSGSNAPGSGSSGTATKKSGVQLTKDGQLANIPPGMLTDAYGMAGLVALLANTESNPNLFSLAIGYDISSINLNLNSKERIYQTYPGPWNEKQLKPYEIDYPVPSEYLIHHNIRDKIADIKAASYSDDLLFFLFYFFAGEQMQMLATTELYARDWRYHKDDGVWIRRQGTAHTEKNGMYERGVYIYFDPHNWMKMQKEMTVEYERLETNPPTGFA